MEKKVLYSTTIENAVGIKGEIKSLTGDFKAEVSSPTKPEPGTNPEQLIGSALATCLNATLEAEEKRRGLEHKSVVRVKVEMGYDTPGYQFWLTAMVKIPQVDHEEAEEILKVCERRCPVAKLLYGSQNVVVKLVDEFEEDK